MSKVKWSIRTTAWSRTRVNPDATAVLLVLPFLFLPLLFKFHLLSVKGIQRKCLLALKKPGLWSEKGRRKLAVRYFLRGRREELHMLCLPLSLTHQEEHTDVPQSKR